MSMESAPPPREEPLPPVCHEIECYYFLPLDATSPECDVVGLMTYLEQLTGGAQEGSGIALRSVFVACRGTKE